MKHPNKILGSVNSNLIAKGKLLGSWLKLLLAVLVSISGTDMKLSAIDSLNEFHSSVFCYLLGPFL